MMTFAIAADLCIRIIEKDLYGADSKIPADDMSKSVSL